MPDNPYLDELLRHLSITYRPESLRPQRLAHAWGGVEGYPPLAGRTPPDTQADWFRPLTRWGRLRDWAWSRTTLLVSCLRRCGKGLL